MARAKIRIGLGQVWPLTFIQFVCTCLGQFVCTCLGQVSISKLTCTSQHTEASAVEIATEAAAIEHDIRTGNLKAGVSHLAVLGGKSKTNCSRDYHRGMSNKEVLELFWVKVPLVCGEDEVPMLLPMSC